MNAKQLGLEIGLIGFLGLNAYVIYQYGYIEKSKKGESVCVWLAEE